MMPHERNKPRRRVAVLGAGISGLTAAFCLTRAGNPADVTLFEASGRIGGVLATDRYNGYLVERSADSFIVNQQMPWAARLAAEAGFDDLVEPLPEHRRALIVRNGQTHPVPDGFYLAAASRLSEVLRSPLLSWRAKLRLAAERFVRANPSDEDESLEQFAMRRVGKEVFERLVQPLVSGIYTADPAKLSIRAALPQLVEMEQRFGSLTTGLRQSGAAAQRSAGARYEMFRAPRWGIQSLLDHVAAQLPAGVLRWNTTVRTVERIRGAAWRVRVEEQRTPLGEDYDAVVVALPAPSAGRVLRATSRQLAEELTGIELAGVAVVCLGYRRDQISHPLDAFGIVVPNVERRDSVAISIASNKFVGRAPDHRVLLRVFLGGALRPELLQRSDQQLVRIATGEVTELLGARGNPEWSIVNRWDHVTPQYHVGHLARLERIDTLVSELPGLVLAGNAYDGIGIPQCVRSGYRAATLVSVDR